MRISIAIDGPAGAGKSTIAKVVGEKFNLMYINTGSMYRAVTLFAMRQNINHNEIEKLCGLLSNMEMHFEGDNLIVNGEDVSNELTLPVISNNVSNYASIPEVRKKLVHIQQSIAKKYNVVMDGRDIGTVVLKDANLKIFLTAKAEERAKRRYSELIENDVDVNYDNILAEIKRRDYIDSTRSVDPLTKATDAIEIDSSYLNIEEVVDKISDLVKKIITNVN